MKSKLLLPVLAMLMLTLTACPGPLTSAATEISSASASVPNEDRTLSSVGVAEDRVIFRGAQALTMASLAYEGVVVVVTYGVDVGLIRGELAAQIQQYNRIALEALRRADAAVTDVDKARYAAVAFEAINNINRLPVIRQVRQLLGRNQS